MKIILSGYEGSKHILAASAYLISKYIPADFEVIFLNYGVYAKRLHRGVVMSLAAEQAGVNSWARDIKGYLESLDDEFVIFALDDYLLAHPMDMHIYESMMDKLVGNKNIACARLSYSDFYKETEFEFFDGDIIVLTNVAQYSVTTQYTVWRREFLIEVLSKVNTPWEFEMAGSDYLNSTGKRVIGMRKDLCLDYFNNSCLSKKWTGVKFDGIGTQDLAELRERGLLNGCN
jgi:hypothetical protein